ncbi:MAG: septal ring lytic transglycosylase RlpA family protein [Campylobacterota bacterium]
MWQISVKLFLSLLGLALLSGCGSSGVYYGAGSYKSTPSTAQVPVSKKRAIHRATFRPYSVFGVQYCPHTVEVGQIMEGMASWYGPDFHGKKTSNGEIYNKYAYTAAHKTWPMDTVVRVDNLENGKSTVVRINDRGPFLRNRVIDLSYSAAIDIKMDKKGTAKVRVTVLKTDSGNWPSDAPRGHSTGATYDECGVSTPSSLISKKSNPNSSESYFVQIASFSSYEAADRYSKRSLNLPHHLEPTIRSGEGLHRVLISGFSSEDEARKFIQTSKFKDSFFVREQQ